MDKLSTGEIVQYHRSLSHVAFLIVFLLLASTLSGATYGSSKSGSNVSSGTGNTDGTSYVLRDDSNSGTEYGIWQLNVPYYADNDCVYSKLQITYHNDRPGSWFQENPPELFIRDGNTGSYVSAGTLADHSSSATVTKQPIHLSYVHPNNGGSSGPSGTVTVKVEATSGEYAEIDSLVAGIDKVTTTPPLLSGYGVSTPSSTSSWYGSNTFFVNTPSASTPDCKVKKWEYAWSTSPSSQTGATSQLGNAPQSSSSSYSITHPDTCADPVYVHLRYQNHADVYSDWTEDGPYKFDNDAPTAQITSPSSNQWKNSIGQISWLSSDSCSGIATQILRVTEGSTDHIVQSFPSTASNDNGFVQSDNYFASSTCRDGDYDLRLDVEDDASNEKVAYGSFKFDNCPPASTSFNYLNEWYNSDSINVGWSSAEDCSSSEECARGVKYTVNTPSTFSGYSGSGTSHTFTNVPDGEHLIELDVCDMLDNCRISTDDITLRVDTNSPTMTLPTKSSISDWSNDPHFWVEVSANDAHAANKVSGVSTEHLLMSTSSTVTKTDSGWVEYSCLDSFGNGQETCAKQQRVYDMSLLGSGVYRAFVYASDVAGNEQAIQSNNQQLYKFDFDAPHGTLDPMISNVLSNGYLDSSTAELSWSAASDAQSNLEVSGIHGYAIGINEMPANPEVNVVGENTVEHTLSGFQDGENFVCLAAIDFSGNVGDWACTDTFQYDATQFDTDGDGISDASDNCPSVSNPGQNDADQDGVGDACEADADVDGFTDDDDNCPSTPNVDQLDSDLDGVGDACDDSDGDAVVDRDDNCPNIANSGQEDVDGDGMGDMCDDSDGDGVFDASDNCKFVNNTGQEDADGNGVGDACEGIGDRDGDGVEDEQDNCPDSANADQSDADNDGIGDACESATDTDEDGILDQSDNCPFISNANQADADDDGVGDACENTENLPPSKVDVKSPVDGAHIAYQNINQESVEWWSANDDDTIVRYALRFNEDQWRYHDDMDLLSFAFPALEAGSTNRVQIYAIDSFGMQGETSSVTFIVCAVDEVPNEDRTTCNPEQSYAESSSGQSTLFGLIGLLGLIAAIAISIMVWKRRNR